MNPVQTIIMLTTGIFCPPVLAIADAPATVGAAKDCQPQVIAICADGGDLAADLLVEVTDDDPAIKSGAAHFYFASDNNSGKPGVMEIKKIVGNPEPGGPWIGVQFSPVPKPLAAQLRLKDQTGQMIGNVMEGSPADVAGFQQYDVITAIDGQDVSNEMGEFLEKVRAFRPGESHAFTLLRAGQTQTANVVIGERPSDDNMPKAKFPSEFEELAGGQVFGRSGLLQKDPQGHWSFKGFNMKDLPDVWSAIPDVDDMDFNIAIPGPGTNQVYLNKVDGKTIRIEKNNDGKITVTKTEKNDGDKSETTTTYNSEGELQAADPEAYKILQDGPTMQFFGIDHLPGLPRLKLEASLKNSEEAMKKLHERMAQLHKQPGAARHGMLFKKFPSGTNFETLPDGSIKVTVRNGQDELVQTYGNADALKNARPELYEKYQKLQDEVDR